MTINIYINNRPMEEYTPSELAEIKVKLTDNAMKAAGYIRRQNEREKTNESRKEANQEMASQS